MKKRIGIVTLISYNYGNRLQNYALCKVIKELGYHVETIPTESNYKVKKILAFLIKPLLKKACNWERFELSIPYGRLTADKLNINRYSFFVAGSDQIWNPFFASTTKREFLYFARSEQRVAYAASIGISEYPDEKANEYGEELKRFKAISVREISAIDIVRRITGRNSELVLDPVLLLSAYDWDKQIGFKPFRTKSYVAMYFLGKKDNPCVEAILKKVYEKGFEIIDIMDLNRQKKGSVGPSEFVKIIRDSEFVITDSFHASVFAIIYHRPFVTVDRSEDKNAGDMSSRIESLLSMFSLEKHRFVRKLEDLDYNYFVCNYDNVDMIVEKEKAKSLTFLKNALE